MTATRRRIRLDPRLLIGSLLVVASVIGVTWVVAAANQTVAVYAAAKPIAQGDALGATELSIVEVPVSETNDLYLTPELLSAEGGTATRPIGAGELIPISAVGAAEQGVSEVVVTVSGALSERIAPGTAVELWSAAPDERPGAYRPPTVVVDEAQVVRVLEAEQFVHSGETEVELRIPEHALAEVLAAATNGARMHLVPLYAAAETESGEE
ncbi:SAF domain-containing protein [Gulosibacter sp. 10]|uniref:SAF domain-containing protein n=1 Tax=Gulosibacter sp. 10 TaxID=1255570 RepID=UPI00097EF4C6|nr:SAF domain-containing protein [Gulosibacter sp. 10]SJM54486.1 hypothetical protein FM112_03560 [Gulosibacter sp. 10]